MTKKMPVVIATSFLVSMIYLCRDFFYYFLVGAKEGAEFIFLGKTLKNYTADSSFFEFLGTGLGIVSVPILLIIGVFISIFVIFGENDG